MKRKKTYHEELKNLIDEYVHFVYKITQDFPKSELYGATSQLRRASLSVILNYIEDYARIGEASYKNFLKISYGSLKESEYLLDFSLKEKYIYDDNYNKGSKMADRIGGMLWGIISNMK
ncbi:MAG: four helix bundle protein [Candidatus Moranbacteria bacterium]|jgi:four helix bundle protein|nr:four helix bundle protein [Candidatus Moranbacteria bacterium]MDX9855572.1 four helix bundle protein [Candidatus Moranbacteria bacterium]